MKDKQPSKKKRFVKLLGIFSIILALTMSSFALYNTTQIGDLKSGDDGISTMSKISTLYGTHGCEEGGFSIQLGMDMNENELLDAEEVLEIKNVCHGKQGESGSMGTRGYRGYNGTNGSNGIDGIDGLIGNSPFIQSYRLSLIHI